MKWIKSILKVSFFTSIVLLFGQVEIAGDTVGSHFKRNVVTFVNWSVREIKHSKLYGHIDRLPSLSDWLKPTPRRPTTVARQEVKAVEPVHKENITESDKQNLIKLLE